MQSNANLSPSRTQLPRDGINAHIGAVIRAHRIMKGWSQSQLAKAVRDRNGHALTFQAIQKYEKGTVEIPLSNLEQMAAAFEISLTALLSPAAPVPDIEKISSRTVRLAFMLERAPTSVYQAIRLLLNDNGDDE